MPDEENVLRFLEESNPVRWKGRQAGPGGRGMCPQVINLDLNHLGFYRLLQNAATTKAVAIKEIKTANRAQKGTVDQHATEGDPIINPLSGVDK